MAVIALRESEDIESVHADEDLLDITEISVPTDNQHVRVIPVVNLVEYLSSPWEEAAGITD